MNKYLLFPVLAAAICTLAYGVRAQTPKSLAVPLRFEYPASGQGIILKWPLDTAFNTPRARRRLLSQSYAFRETPTTSSQKIITLLSDTSAIDSSYLPGMMAEYEITFGSRTTTGAAYQRTGVLPVCKDCPVTESRGTLILVVERLVRDSLALELLQLIQDLQADGWKVRMVPVAATDPVVAVRDSISRIYLADPTHVKTVYLLGNVPVPYAGDILPDGHTEHKGAWPADGYYVALNAQFTDVTVNSSTAARAQNKNIPGDGKFDQSLMSNFALMGIGRVSLQNLTQFATTNAKYTETYLLRRYLQKAHRFKMGRYKTNNRGIIDDNFGYFGAESFATAGWIGMNSCLGTANAVAGDFLTSTRTQPWLMAYGCGGGSYTVCSDVVSTGNFARDSVNAVFTSFFGSYFGDWDSQDNLLRAAIASRGGVLASAWNGRPWVYYHLMGMGRPYGETALITLNNSASALRYNYGARMVSIGFMGDPSLRLQYFTPPTAVQARQAGSNTIEVRWSPGQDTVSGYHVYRATSDTSAYVRVTQTPVQDTVYRDAVLQGQVYYYMVRGVQTQGYPGGSYINQSLGAFTGSVSVITGTASTIPPTIRLYPNPTQGRVKVESSQVIQAIEMFDGLGRMVQLLPVGDRTADLDLAGLPKGVYTLKLQTGGVWQVRRVAFL